MFLRDGRLVASPTDLANFLTCRHKTALDLRVAHGLLEKPSWTDPLAKILQERGAEHEARFVAELRRQGLNVLDFGPTDGGLRPLERLARTRDALSDGVDVIVQGALGDGEWFGYPDVLRRVDAHDWYEVLDTKLARETRGGTILQLCVYSDLLAAATGRAPAAFHVVTPIAREPYRFDDYSAFYRQMKQQFGAFVAAETSRVADSPTTTYPEPVDHCSVCRWSGRCERQRRDDDHLSLVAGLGRNHIRELRAQSISTLSALAGAPIPLQFKPKRGSTETFEKLREQARLQLEQRSTGQPTYECLPIEQGFGLCALPAPRPGDLFLDLEGDPFGRQAGSHETGAGNREYLFGLGRISPDGSFAYTARWAFDDVEEREQFDATMGDIMAAIDADPEVHIYHYASYEPATFKRLMGRYATRESDVDRLLRGRRFIDLYAIVRHALRAGVESYSIKYLEPFYKFTREVELHEAGDQRRIVEIALETGETTTITPSVRAAVEGYNKDDVRSTSELRAWLESIRAQQVADGRTIERPPLVPGDAPEELDEKARAVEALRARLLDGVPSTPAERSPDQQGRHLLAFLLDWHRRENKAEWWEYFRLRELPETELFEEPRAVAGLTFVADVQPVKKSMVQRYAYPPQEMEIRVGDTLKQQDGTRFGATELIDRNARTIDMLVGPSRVAARPTALFAHDHVNAGVVEDALMAIGEAAADAGGIENLPPSPVRSLLLRLPPALRQASFAALSDKVVEYARAVVTDLDCTALPIQGPPGSGKTYTGARMIESCAAAGMKIGVTANSHKVIRNLLKEVGGDAARLGQKGGREDDADETAETPDILMFDDNDDALTGLQSGAVNVLGGTAWLWARPGFIDSVDVLFVDEAGQMSLANVLGVARAAKSIVLLGDPQQLDQPTKGSHPDGVGVSALQHILGEAETMPADRGLFLPVTWRLTPSICRFTSELFYAGQLSSKPGLERQTLTGRARVDLFQPFADLRGNGLWLVSVEHFGNRNASDEEAAAVVDLVDYLLADGSQWIDETGESHQMTANDIRIITPFNAQVARIREAFEGRSLNFEVPPVGTVDKFQGQEAPVAIYSMATSHPDDAPKGMEFLYSLNRLNVATSRARCAAIVVLSPKLFEPDCQRPRQMHLANALVRFREMAKAL